MEGHDPEGHDPGASENPGAGFRDPGDLENGFRHRFLRPFHGKPSWKPVPDNDRHLGTYVGDIGEINAARRQLGPIHSGTVRFKFEVRGP